ncbi:3-phosphoglycerate dehydrogenase [Nitrincola sp. A-D6]|uniref:D-2-hydroxyacid dehydrogenase family protein n=1 Tax=Nitrincola sp. A-D6 TaxID=1545442 RepID=UPI00051FAAF8|nr:D-2-hydroxyacid dehydrogenase family protein [Nitrincola sp. A-D6]KGK40904.1 3-phosphoglycerate dehydrogenase [Nitrincola sp. A-D6]
MKIAVLDDYQNIVKTLDCFNLLSGHDVDVLNETYTDTNELALKLSHVEALVLIRERTQITDELLSKLPNLKLISQTGKISNHLNLDMCHKYGVAVAEGIGSPVAPAEFCWALIMAASRNIPEYVSNLSLSQWQQAGVLGLGRTLNGLTLGIWGYGKIGQRIAQYAKAFGMSVVVWGSDSSRQLAEQHGFMSASSKHAFFTESDIVSLHLRLNEVTKGCVTQADLALMKSDSLFVNTSRAELVEANALYTEMQANPSKRAALDVFSVEPATAEKEPLLSLPNVLCSPHLGYVEKNSYELYFKIAFENVLAFAQGKPQNLAKV